jgi:Zn finger protein HypA/HybF involved in hydrogenase expression
MSEPIRKQLSSLEQDLSKCGEKSIATRAKELVEEGDYVGICIECGHEQDGCEPDAREYTCENCGTNKVYGAEEIILQGL